MMSRIGRKTLLKISKKKITGFTLIELAIITVIILIIIAGSIPLFGRTYRSLELNNCALNISKLIRFAQERAIVESNSLRINFDFTKKTYWLTAQDLQGSEFKAFKNDRFGAVFKIPDSMEIEGEKNLANFYPDGRSDKISIKLSSKDESLYLSTSLKAGYVNISKEDPEIK